VTHYFARASPFLQSGETSKDVEIKVSQDRIKCTLSVGSAVLKQWIKGSVVALPDKYKASKHKTTWGIKIGPYAKHTVEVENSNVSKIVKVLVDGSPLVESTPEDIDCSDGNYSCKFKFYGERIANFEVFKTNRDGTALNATAKVPKRFNYFKECEVAYQGHDLLHATFTIDGVEFKALEQERELPKEPELVMDAGALQMQFGITVPSAIDEDAPTGLAVFANVIGGGQGSEDGFCSIFSKLFGCCTPQVSESHMKVT